MKFMTYLIVIKYYINKYANNYINNYKFKLYLNYY